MHAKKEKRQKYKNMMNKKAKLKFSMLIFASGLDFVSMKFIMLEASKL